MGNCLFKNLRSSVDDSNFLKLGEMIIHFSGADSASAISFATDQTLKIVEGSGPGTFQGGATEKNVSRYVSTTFNVTGECDVLIEDKYHIYALSLGGYNTNKVSINVNDLENSDTLVIFSVKYSDSYGNISALTGKNLVTLDMTGSENIYGNFDSIGLAGTTLTRLALANVTASADKIALNTHLSFISGTNITGNIADLEDCILLTGLYLSRSTVNGNIEDMLSGMVEKGRAASNTPLTISANASQCKFHNTTPPSYLYSFFGATYNGVSYDIVISTDSAMNNVVATYKDSTWTYI